MSKSLRIVYGTGDELTLRSLSDFLKENGIEYSLLSSDEDMDHIMVDMPFGYLRADKFARVIQTNGYLEKTYQIQSDELYGTNWQKLIHEEDKKRLLIQLAKEFFVIKTTVAVSRIVLRPDFEISVMIIINSLMNDDNERVGFRILIIDVSQIYQKMGSETQDDSTDTITQLPDRVAFLSTLEETLQRSRRARAHAALILIHIQGVDKINQLSGYLAGDNLLRDFASALKTTVGKKGHVSRIESSKFAVILDAVTSPEEIEKLIRSIQKDCSLTIEAVYGRFSLVLSIGVAYAGENISGVEGLLRHADEALKLAIKQPENKVVISDEKSHQQFHRAAILEAQLFNAISQNQFQVYYQPQIDAITEKLVGFEALIRWVHPELGMIFPDEFIAIAESSGFILQIGKWMNNQALSQFEQWLNQFQERMQHIKLSINLSPMQLTDETLLEDFSALLIKYHIPASHIIFELTEEAVMQYPDVCIQVLNQLKHLGVGLSMDDFGTGYSSLSYIRSLPINQIKIDRSFITAFQTNIHDAAVIKATILLADALGMEVVAEGVETKEELQFLRENGCQTIQGYYFSPPLDKDAMTTYILRNL